MNDVKVSRVADSAPHAVAEKYEVVLGHMNDINRSVALILVRSCGFVESKVED